MNSDFSALITLQTLQVRCGDTLHLSCSQPAVLAALQPLQTAAPFQPHAPCSCFSNSRISFLVTAIVSPLCAAGKSPAGDTETCTLASGSACQQPTACHFLVDTLHCKTTTPAFPSSLANACPWTGVCSPCISRCAIQRPWGHDVVWPGRGDSTWLELFCLIHPLCRLKQQTKRFLKMWSSPS